MTEYPNVITPRRLAAAQIARRAQEAREDAEAAGDQYGDVWVFFMRLAELLQGAADDVAAVIDPPE